EDAGPEDAGPEDAGPEDAGPEDAGPEDAGPYCLGSDPCGDSACDGAACTADIPSPVCADVGTLRTFSDAGLCADGSCALSFTDTLCDGPCVDGACVPCVSTDWSTTSVDTDGDRGLFPDLEVDALGQVHVAYSDRGSVSVRYARRSTDGSWVTELAHPDGSSPAIAVAPSGDVHVLAHNFMHGGDLLGTRSPGGTWARQNRDPVRGLFYDATVTPAGDLLYSHLRSVEVQLATLVSGVWTTETVPTPAERPTHSSVLFDREGTLHIAYRAQTPQDIWYSRRTVDGTWTHSLVADGANNLASPVLALDGSAPVIAYADGTRSAVFIATPGVGGAWVSELVEEDASASSVRTPVSVDPRGGIHLVYRAPVRQRVRHAYRAPGGSWVHENVLESTGALVPNIEVGRDLRLHVAFFTSPGDDLSYATRQFCITAPD
ncbi:MAG: hypothetical protein AB8I08_37305, partial [Sandaracinaceae bacterium]